MRGNLVFAFISRDNFAEHRIREISNILAAQENSIFIITTPTKNSFKHFIHELGEGIPIYNRGDYVSPADILAALWGFNTIWIFYADSHEHFDLSECSARVDQFNLLIESHQCHSHEQDQVKPS